MAEELLDGPFFLDAVARVERAEPLFLDLELSAAELTVALGGVSTRVIWRMSSTGCNCMEFNIT